MSETNRELLNRKTHIKSNLAKQARNWAAWEKVLHRSIAYLSVPASEAERCRGSFESEGLYLMIKWAMRTGVRA